MGDDESAEQAAVSRRERLKALKAAKELLSTPDNDVNKEPESFVSPVPVVAGRFDFIFFLFFFESIRTHLLLRPLPVKIRVYTFCNVRYHNCKLVHWEFGKTSLCLYFLMVASSLVK